MTLCYFYIKLKTQSPFHPFNVLSKKSAFIKRFISIFTLAFNLFLSFWLLHNATLKNITKPWTKTVVTKKNTEHHDPILPLYFIFGNSLKPKSHKKFPLNSMHLPHTHQPILLWAQHTRIFLSISLRLFFKWHLEQKKVPSKVEKYCGFCNTS